jgi:hypothetical protein
MMPYTDPEAFTGPDRTGLDPGVWPKPRGLLPRHFQVIGVNRRTLVVSDMGGFIELGGVQVTDPDHLDEIADRLHELADLRRKENN